MKYNSLKNIAFLLTFLIFVLLPIRTFAEMPPPPPDDNNTDNGNGDDNYITYSNSDFNFSIDYPQGWYPYESDCSIDSCGSRSVFGLSYLATVSLSSIEPVEGYQVGEDPMSMVSVYILERQSGFAIENDGIHNPDGSTYNLEIGGYKIVNGEQIPLLEIMPLSIIEGNGWRGIERGYSAPDYFEVRTFIENNPFSRYIYYVQYWMLLKDDIENEKTIYRNMMDSLVITPSSVDAELLRATNGYKVYEIKNGKRHWIPTAEIFSAHNFDWNNIQIVSESQLNSYPRAKLIRATGDKKVYYLTESGMVRHIPSPEVFNSYGNNWEDIFEVSPDELNTYEPNNLIRAEGDCKVYLLENGKKHWIKTAKEFNDRGYDWNKIAPVN